MDDKFSLLTAETANKTLPFEAFNSATFAAADIAVRCAICEESTPINSMDYRAHGVFICDKCKAAIKHVRDYLEIGGSVV